MRVGDQRLDRSHLAQPVDRDARRHAVVAAPERVARGAVNAVRRVLARELPQRRAVGRRLACRRSVCVRSTRQDCVKGRSLHHPWVIEMVDGLPVVVAIDGTRVRVCVCVARVGLV